MRLLIDAHHLGRRETGNETWTRNLVAAIAPLEGSDQIEYAVTDSGRAELATLTGGLGQVHTVSERSPVRLLVDVPRIARRRRSDVVAALYAMPVTARPTVLLVHDLSLEDPEAAHWVPARWRLSHRQAIRASCHLAAHVLTPSEFTRRQVIDLLDVPAARVSVAPGATDAHLEQLLHSTPPAPRPSSSFAVLAVGNVLPRKNLVVLAQAVRAGRDEGMDLRLRVVGSVARHGEAEARTITALLGEAVSFSGYVTPHELAAAYRSADVLCFPSRFEGFGLPVLEAMTAGVPVVVSDRTSLPEIAEDAALVVPATDYRAWLSALRLLVTAPEVAETLRRRGFARARTFSWERTAKTLLDAARAAASSGRRAEEEDSDRALQR